MNWRSLVFTAARWGFSSRRQASWGRSLFASAGIAAGVTALIVVIGVMGGLQQGYISSILEISSFHIRLPGDDATFAQTLEKLDAVPSVESAVAFKEKYLLATAATGRSATLNIRAFQPDAGLRDTALVRALGLDQGSAFPPGTALLLGREAAESLGVSRGSFLELYGLRQTAEEGVLPIQTRAEVGGEFHSGYYEFDASMAFISMDDKVFSSLFTDSKPVIGIKLHNRFRDLQAMAEIRSVLPETSAQPVSWREFNSSFFGALRTEKAVMMMLISLIFAVVGINIFHAMRRTIASKMSDIAIMKTFGGSDADLRRIFAFEGFAIGILGSLGGVLAGILLANNVNQILGFIARAFENIVSFLGKIGLVAVTDHDFRLFSPAYFYIDKIPVAISPWEIFFIAALAILAAGLAALVASRKVLDATPSEVFRDE